MNCPTILVLVGVAGSGKTTIGRLLSRELQWPFFDADAFHPDANIAKMSAGVPLTEEDRWPWLRNVKVKIDQAREAGNDAIFACSALRQSYRDFLTRDAASVKLVYLRGNPPLLSGRLAERKGHFMREEMLASQLATLEEPQDCLTVDVSLPPETIVEKIVRELALPPRNDGEPSGFES